MHAYVHVSAAVENRFAFLPCIAQGLGDAVQRGPEAKLLPPPELSTPRDGYDLSGNVGAALSSGPEYSYMPAWL